MLKFHIWLQTLLVPVASPVRLSTMGLERAWSSPSTSVPSSLPPWGRQEGCTGTSLGVGACWQDNVRSPRPHTWRMLRVLWWQFWLLLFLCLLVTGSLFLSYFVVLIPSPVGAFAGSSTDWIFPHMICWPGRASWNATSFLSPSRPCCRPCTPQSGAVEVLSQELALLEILARMSKTLQPCKRSTGPMEGIYLCYDKWRGSRL